MKTLCSAVAVMAIVGTQATAGGYHAPVVEEVVVPKTVVIEEAASSSSQGIIVPLFALIVFAAAFVDIDSGPVFVSDARLKTDIAPTGDTAGGMPIYTYRYIGGTATYRGVMAQDVAKMRPDAIVTHDSGYMMVDYGKLGLEMTVVD